MNSKKNKRQSRQSAAAPANSASVSQPSTPPAYSFSPDYSIVVKDLGRIGILAGTFVTLLIIISVFLQ
jgi:hypothetical protein